jgi:hypothetical protein
MKDWKAMGSSVSPHQPTHCWVLFKHYRSFRMKEGLKAEPGGKAQQLALP